jgi:hypothetical protein
MIVPLDKVFSCELLYNWGRKFGPNLRQFLLPTQERKEATDKWILQPDPERRTGLEMPFSRALIVV